MAATAVAFHSGTRTRCSAAIPPSTSSGCRGCGTFKGGCSPRWSASPCSSRSPTCCGAGSGRRRRASPRRSTPAARAHLSVLLGLMMLVKAYGYWLGRFDLLTSQRGVVEGASYTEVKAQLPALKFLTIVAVICALLFFLNIRTRHGACRSWRSRCSRSCPCCSGPPTRRSSRQFRVKSERAAARDRPYIEPTSPRRTAHSA